MNYDLSGNCDDDGDDDDNDAIDDDDKGSIGDDGNDDKDGIDDDDEPDRKEEDMYVGSFQFCGSLAPSEHLTHRWEN